MKKFALVNGKIYVERGRFAQALYAEDGVIRLVGRDDEIRSAAGRGAEILDCEGGAVIPGLNDSHMHLLGVGMEMSHLHPPAAIREILPAATVIGGEIVYRR